MSKCEFTWCSGYHRSTCGVSETLATSGGGLSLPACGLVGVVSVLGDNDAVSGLEQAPCID